MTAHTAGPIIPHVENEPPRTGKPRDFMGWKRRMIDDNAALRAQRDELAEALRALTSMADRYADSDPYLEAAMKRARAALAKLDGGK